MPVRVLSVLPMPCNVQIWTEDRDDGHFIVYVSNRILGDDGARSLEGILNATISDRLDNATLRRALRAVTG